MSRVERLLKAIIQNGSYDEERLSRVEDILYAFLKDHEYTKDPESRMEALLIFLKEKKLYDDVTLSRVEDILKAKIDGVEYTKAPESRVEELLIMWDVITEYEKFVSGVLPLHLTDSIGADLVDWLIEGDTVQDGEPSPENPIEVKGVGDRTGNWLSLIDTNKQSYGLTVKCIDNIVRVYGTVVDFNATVDIPLVNTIPQGLYTKKVYLINGNATGLQTTIRSADTKSYGLHSYGEVPQSENITFTGYLFRVQVNKGLTIDCTFNIMLNEGSTPLLYEPYGVKIPVVSRGKNKYSLEEFTNAFRKLVLSKDENSIVSWICSQNSKSVVLFDNFAPNTQYVLHLFGKNDSASGSLWTNLRVNYSDGNSDSIKFTEIGVMSVASFVSRPNRTISSISNSWDTVSTTLDLSKSYIIEGSEDIYEPYRPPITTTQYLPTPLMANERLTPTAREVKWGKLVLTGSEDWMIESVFNFYCNKPVQNAKRTQLVKCTHFKSVVTYIDRTGNCFISSTGKLNMQFNDFSDNLSGFVDWLKSEYDKGTPVTVWYQLAAPTSESVETTPIGTLDGECWIDVDTEVRPPYAEVTYLSSEPQYFILDKSLLDNKEEILR